ncbi:MAG: hypothetical protein IJY94_06165 [Clostridia bacterium]|nr:hypothetical protein [Clostridia bacterium]
MIWLEIFGYIGTALVLISMMMTKLSMLRVFNICGSVISAAYSYLSDAMPVVLLNLGLIAINLTHLLMEKRRKKHFNVICKEANDEAIDAFLVKNGEDIKRRFPDFVLNIGDGSKIYMVYSGNEPVGIFIGREEDGDLRISFGYSVPGYKYSEVVLRFMTELGENGYASPESEILMPFKRRI